jgi:EAL domain-containing protein (putative c-di-GMP-specific phosphodiesterase class I)
MAHSLRRVVVADGVETEAQARLLRELRCDEMQGFYILRPVPLEVFDEFVARRVAHLLEECEGELPA